MTDWQTLCLTVGGVLIMLAAYGATLNGKRRAVKDAYNRYYGRDVHDFRSERREMRYIAALGVVGIVLVNVPFF